MKPQTPLPHDASFVSAEDYVESLLRFTTTNSMFQLLCGGVHVLDFFTTDGGLFQHVIPVEWQEYLRQTDSMRFLDVLMREDMNTLEEGAVPSSLLEYIRLIRLHALARDLAARSSPLNLPALPRHVSVGMKPKKVHEVTHFADFVDRLASEVNLLRGAAVSSNGPVDHHEQANAHVDTHDNLGEQQVAAARKITHLVDFGSGQNYLGRTLSSAPYNRHIVAVESSESNINGAKDLDTLAGLAEKEVVQRNKKLWKQVVDSRTPENQLSVKARNRLAKGKIEDAAADLRPKTELKKIYVAKPGQGFVHYVAGRLENGDLSEVIAKLKEHVGEGACDSLQLMGVSIHSCGNLTHHGIRSLVINPEIKAVAIVGCCYNKATEKLGPPTYKHLYMRPTLQAVNGRIVRESERRDPQGFPMSRRLTECDGVGVRLNITARMMACQAPYNWTEVESDAFFTRHFFRAILQKMFLDRGVINRVYHGAPECSPTTIQTVDGAEHSKSLNTLIGDSPFNMSTNPIIIGSLPKKCYTSFHKYVRGAIAKLVTDNDYIKYSPVVEAKMVDLTDDEITHYEAQYRDRKRELSSVWSLMAFSATVVESLMVTDRWLFLREHDHVVQDCWVQPVFDYRLSPRNLVVVGIKK